MAAPILCASGIFGLLLLENSQFLVSGGGGGWNGGEPPTETKETIPQLIVMEETDFPWNTEVHPAYDFLWQKY